MQPVDSENRFPRRDYRVGGSRGASCFLLPRPGSQGPGFLVNIFALQGMPRNMSIRTMLTGGLRSNQFEAKHTQGQDRIGQKCGSSASS